MAHTPRIEFDPALPISAEVERIAGLVRDHQVVVVAGETGSGKTTQLPKICLVAGREHIAHTQPRRIAARSVATRIAEEMGVEIGDFVGFQVRFTRKVTKATRLKVMTDGVLLSELTHDRDLRRYDTIIIDEAHERSLNIDFLLGYLKQLLPRRPDLRVIVTSATIDTARFSEHFNDAPVVEISGRTHPVDLRYRPLEEDQDEIDGITEALTEIVTESNAGDVLVFLSGEREIRDASEAIAAMDLAGWEVLPLYARLSAADQQRVFQTHRSRRVVLATNVAETSITVPGIRYVIDVGTARISRYSARTKVQRLPIEDVSRASANQRAGRCGRVGPGIAIRLYDEENFDARSEFTEPEILRTNLATVILQMAQAGLGDIESFPFVEAPPASQINDGVRVLSELGAISPRKRHQHVRLTRDGRLLAQMPVDPRLGRMLLEASRRGVLAQVTVLVAGLTVPDVRERPAERQEAADQLHRRFWQGPEPDRQPPAAPSEEPPRHTAHTNSRKQQPVKATLEGGDFEVLLNVWEYLRRRRRELSGSAFRRMCRDEYLHFLRFREWEDLVSQLKEVTRELELDRPRGGHRTSANGTMADVVTSLLAGLLSHVGLAEPEPPRPKQGSRRRPLVEYRGARGARFALQPGSSVPRGTPLVVAYELVETSRLWARTVAPVKPEWIELVGQHVLTRTLSEPHWSSRNARVMARETISLFGVPIVADRQVDLSSQEPETAREIFIRSALVEGEWETRNPVVSSNRFAMTEAEELAQRMRRPELVISDDQLYEFYDRRLPASVLSGATFDAHVRGLADDSELRLTPADCLTEPGALDVSSFPDRWRVGEHELKVAYVFEPGSGHDGATIDVPLEVLNQLEQTPFTWQVPGLRRDLATALIRGLPKQVRTRFVPAPDWAGRALAWVEDHVEVGSVPFADALARALLALTGEQVPPGAWRPDDVPDYLRPGFRILDGSRLVAEGTDLDRLRRDLAATVATKLTRAATRLTSTGQTSWTFGDIPGSSELSRGVIGFPALVDEGTSVGVAVLDKASRAAMVHVRGLRRLLVLTNPSPVRWVVAHLGNADKLALGASAYPSVPDLLADAWLKASHQLLVSHADPDDVRDAAAYSRVADLVRAEAPARTADVVRVAAGALAAQAQVDRLLQGFSGDDPIRLDVSEQLRNLTFNRFISATPDPWFARIPSYVQGAHVRLEAASRDRGRDDRARAQVEAVEAAYGELTDAFPPGPLPPAVEDIAFLIEEFRISLFAQSVRTSVPVSEKRIRQAIARARAEL